MVREGTETHHIPLDKSWYTYTYVGIVMDLVLLGVCIQWILCFHFVQFVGGPGAHACIIEESEVDSAAKTFTTYTRNITFSKLMSVEEKCVYYPSPENEQW